MRQIAMLAVLSLLLIHTPVQQQAAPKAANHNGQPDSPQAQSETGVPPKEVKKENVAQSNTVAHKKDQVPTQDDPNYALIGLIVNVVLTIVTLIIAIAGLIQARAAKESADIATNSQRSWIVETGVDKADLTEVWIPRITCRFEVFGNSPVRVIEAKFRFHTVNGRQIPKTPRKEPDLPETPDYGEVDTLTTNPQMGKVYPPGEKFSVVASLDDLFFEKGDVAAIDAGDKFLCIYGFMSYRDAFSKSKTRTSRFCYVHGIRYSITANERQFVIGGPPAYNEVT